MRIRPRDEFIEILQHPKTIAVVGLSSDPEADAHEIPRYMQEQGYRVIPVNPNADEILGVPAVDSLADIDEPVDIVDVFRPPAEGPGIVRQAADIGAPVVWFQPATDSREAIEAAEQAGVEVVTGACIRVAHRMLFS